MTIEKFKEYFEDIYNTEITKILNNFNNYGKNTEIQKLTEKIKKISLDGKRVRPYVCALAFEPKKTLDLKKIKNQLVAIELLHLFALIHDDLMDNSMIRHGNKTINSYGRNEKEIIKSKNEAVIIGDYIFASSYSLFLKENKEPKTITIFQKLIEEVIFGQTLDLELSQNTKYNTHDVKNKMLLKTARYTFSRPIQIGLMLAGIKDKKTLKKAGAFGDAFGLMFQVDDDLLDIFGNKNKMKKNTFQDIESNQATILTAFTFENKKYKNLLTKFLGKKVKESDKEEIKRIFTESKALQKSIDYKNNLQKEAEKNLFSSKNFLNSWKIILEKIANRNK